MILHYVTGNKNKFENAKNFFSIHDIQIKQFPISIAEIQDSDPIKVAKHKAKQAWEELRTPLFVNDASWSIPALGGFPGPFMKYINEWFQPVDFINIMRGKQDRRIILTDTIVYVDGDVIQTFTNKHEGFILESIDSREFRHPTDVVVSLSNDRLSIAEKIASGTQIIEEEEKVWMDFAKWLKR